MIDALQDRITASADGLSAEDNGEFAVLLDQRARVLTESVQPLVALATGDAAADRPDVPDRGRVRHRRPGRRRPAGHRRPLRPAEHRGAPGRASGSSSVPPSASAATAARRPRGWSADCSTTGRRARCSSSRSTPTRRRTPARSSSWARKRSTDVAEAARLSSVAEPAGAVLAPRPKTDEVAAVLLLAPKGTARRALSRRGHPARPPGSRWTRWSSRRDRPRRPGPSGTGSSASGSSRDRRRSLLRAWP